MKKLLLVTPPNNHRKARDISGLSHIEVLRIVAEANGLAFNASQDGKVYIGIKNNPPPVATQKDNGGLLYPLSGVYLERHPENNSDKYAANPNSGAAPLVKGKPGTKLSPNFTLGEFMPASIEHGAANYDGVRVHPALVEALETIRKKAGGAIRITSGYRPPDYNLAVGGVPNSMHRDGLAADIYTDHLSTSELCRICDAVIGSGGGVGYYPTQGFVHVDVRGHRVRW